MCIVITVFSAADQLIVMRHVLLTAVLVLLSSYVMYICEEILYGEQLCYVCLCGDILWSVLV